MGQMLEINDKAVQEVIRKIVEGADPEKIILFGSFAKGKIDGNSDVDLLVIMDTDLSYLERYKLVSGLARPRVFPIDLLVLTPSEVEKRMAATNSVIRDAVENGRVVYEKNNVRVAR